MINEIAEPGGLKYHPGIGVMHGTLKTLSRSEF